MLALISWIRDTTFPQQVNMNNQFVLLITESSHNYLSFPPKYLLTKPPFGIAGVVSLFHTPTVQ